jgi:hypothetical protein
MLRRLFALGAAAVTGATLSFAGPLGVRAVGPSDVILFVSEATIASDAGVGCDAAGPDIPAALDLVGGCGAYAFTSIACEGVSDGDPTPLERDACTITSSGTVMNTRCGTGQAIGTGGAAVISGPNGDDLSITSYTLNFTAGIGRFTPVTFTDNSPDNGPNTPKVADGSESVNTAASVILLTPPNTAANILSTVTHSVLGPGRGEDCVTGFGIVGLVVANEDGGVLTPSSSVLNQSLLNLPHSGIDRTRPQVGGSVGRRRGRDMAGGGPALPW